MTMNLRIRDHENEKPYHKGQISQTGGNMKE